VEIKVLGTGCSRCRRLYEEAKKAIVEAGIPATLQKVERREEIESYKVLCTPALVINEKVKSAGRIPEAKEIAGWLSAAAREEKSSS
jgi:small redox-active disulfide protein 2